MTGKDIHLASSKSLEELGLFMFPDLPPLPADVDENTWQKAEFWAKEKWWDTYLREGRGIDPRGIEWSPIWLTDDNGQLIAVFTLGRGVDKSELLMPWFFSLGIGNDEWPEHYLVSSPLNASMKSYSKEVMRPPNPYSVGMLPAVPPELEQYMDFLTGNPRFLPSDDSRFRDQKLSKRERASRLPKLGGKASYSEPKEKHCELRKDGEKVFIVRAGRSVHRWRGEKLFPILDGFRENGFIHVPVKMIEQAFQRK